MNRANGQNPSVLLGVSEGFEKHTVIAQLINNEEIKKTDNILSRKCPNINVKNMEKITVWNCMDNKFNKKVQYCGFMILIPERQRLIIKMIRHG